MPPEYFFEKDVLKSRNEQRSFFLFLDFDGTLVPIRNNPAECVLSPEIRRLLEAIAASKRSSVAVLSGRSLSDIKERVRMQGIYYGGSHGLEISGPSIRYVHPGAVSARRFVDEVRHRLERNIRKIEGVSIENKRLTFSLHYRLANKENSVLARKQFYRVISDNNCMERLTVIRGKKVLELAPNVAWNKGRALLIILSKFKGNIVPVYVGDDLTDESAFEVLNEGAVTIRVGKSKRTAARYYLKGQWEISKFLQRVNDVLQSGFMQEPVQ